VTGLRGRAGIAGGALIIAALGGFAIPAATTTAPALAATTPAQGVDVASFQHTTAMPTIDWPGIASSGVTFAGVKASEGNYYTNPYYAGNVAKSYEADAQQAVNAGLYVTPYIFANPHAGNGTAAQQADYGAAVIKASTSPAYSGSHMLPVTLDIEPNPYANSDQCYGLTQSAMQTWISQFMTEIKKDLPTSKTPIVYTTADWWNACTGNDTAFSAYPLWLASYGVTNPALPAGWNNYTIWQYGQGTVDGISGIDQDELGPVLQVAQAGKAVGTVRLRTLNSLAGQAVTYSATGLPPGLTLNSASGQITGTPAAGDIGHQYTVSVTPSAGALPSSMSFTWIIHGALTVASPGNRTTTAGTPVGLRIGISDQDGASYPPQLSVSGLPPGLAMDSTGLITGWPTKPGTYTVHVSASDGLYASGSATFTWTISAAADSGSAGQIRQVGGTGKCLDDPASNTANGTKVDLWSCTGKSNQSWTTVQDGTIRVLGHCLAASGTTVELWACSSSYLNQQWRAATDSELVNAASGLCLYYPNASAGNGAKPTMKTCANIASQSGEHWGRPAGSVVSGEPGKCMAVSGSTVELASCANAAAQDWAVSSDGTIRLGSNCLTESGTTAGSGLVIGSCSGSATTKWTLVSATGSQVPSNPIATEIASANSASSGLCVATPSSTAGAKLTLQACGSTTATLANTWHIE
jgi:GH25 family lysozyme M1 (1,4-beta-N-acetylmuramidase)